MAKQSKSKRASSREGSARFDATPVVALGKSFHARRDWLWGVSLILAVILIYSPVWWAGYIWDDGVVVTANPVVVGPLGLKEIWTTRAADICPLTLSTFRCEYALWGLAPLPFHVVNVLLHGACAVLLWQVLRHLQIPGAWLGAAFWALHPVNVESVAWITEMKNTESGVFFLLSILFFVRLMRAKESDGRTRAHWNYAFSLLFAVMAMASKSSTVVLPVVLGLCAWWVEGRWKWTHLKIIGPILAVSLSAGAASIWTQTLLLDTHSDTQRLRAWPERLVGAGDAVWFYLGKLLCPYPLITVYPQWRIDLTRWLSYLPLLAVIGILSILWINRKSWARPWFLAFAYFIAALLPVLGLLDNTIFSYSLVFDHFQYLAGMGPLALAGAGMFRWWSSATPRWQWLPLSLAAALLVAIGMLSWDRARVFESNETIWTDTVAKNPNSWMGHDNLGAALFDEGRFDEAITQYQNALEIEPNLAETHCDLGNALKHEGRLDDAIAEYQKALKINSNIPVIYYDLANALLQKGQVDAAVVQYLQALKVNPDYVDAHNNLGWAFLTLGRTYEAIAQFQKALELSPKNTLAKDNLVKAQAMARQRAIQK